MRDAATHNRNLRLAALWAALAILLVAGSLWVASHGKEVIAWTLDAAGVDRGKPERHYIPEGFTGWAAVNYLVPGAPELPVRDGALVFEYDESGRLETSSPRNEGVKQEEYFSWVEGRPVRLEQAGRGEELLIGDPPAGERRIWRTYSASEYLGDGEAVGRSLTGFFVGTKRQFESAGSPQLWDIGHPRDRVRGAAAERLRKPDRRDATSDP